MYYAASDPGIWAGHIARDRNKRGVFEPYFGYLLVSGKALTVIDIASGRIVGGSSYYVLPTVPDSIAIGFTFLVKEKWGGSTDRELKR